jgi:anti-anti-sigma factor
MSDGHGTPSGAQTPVGPGKVTVRQHAPGIAVVAMSGEHDLHTQVLLAHALELGAHHEDVVVDLTECSFLDSTIMRTLIFAACEVRSGGEQLVLVIPPAQAQVARVAEIVGLAQFADVHPSSKAAIAALEHSRARGPDACRPNDPS